MCGLRAPKFSAQTSNFFFFFFAVAQSGSILLSSQKPNSSIHVKRINYVRYVCSHQCVSCWGADEYLPVPSALGFAANPRAAGCLTLQGALLPDCRTPVQLGVNREQKARP